jgi:hypothetical protein
LSTAIWVSFICVAPGIGLAVLDELDLLPGP